jgi:hypothetical protein
MDALVSRLEPSQFDRELYVDGEQSAQEELLPPLSLRFSLPPIAQVQLLALSILPLPC